MANCETKPVSEAEIKAVVPRHIRRSAPTRASWQGPWPRPTSRGEAASRTWTLEHQARKGNWRAWEPIVQVGPKCGLRRTRRRYKAWPISRSVSSDERRLREILQELGSLESQSVDEAIFGRHSDNLSPCGIAQLSRQTRIIRALIERVIYNRKTKQLTVSFRPKAIRAMCRGGKATKLTQTICLPRTMSLTETQCPASNMALTLVNGCSSESMPATVRPLMRKPAFTSFVALACNLIL